MLPICGYHRYKPNLSARFRRCRPLCVFAYSLCTAPAKCKHTCPVSTFSRCQQWGTHSHWISAKHNDHQHSWEQLLNRWLPVCRCNIFSNFGKPPDCKEELGVNTSCVHREAVFPDDIGTRDSGTARFQNKRLQFRHILCLRELLDHRRYDSIPSTHFTANVHQVLCRTDKYALLLLGAPPEGMLGTTSKMIYSSKNVRMPCTLQGTEANLKCRVRPLTGHKYGPCPLQAHLHSS